MRFNVLTVVIFTLLTFTTEYYLLDSYTKTLYTQNIFFFHFESLYSYLLCLKANFLTSLSFKTLTINALVFTFKFVITIALLIFIRGGVPRYRYDFLTKIG